MIVPNTKELLAIQGEQEAVAALLVAVTHNRPEISDFLDKITPDVGFQFCAWFIGQLCIQAPGIAKDFAEALKIGIQVAGVCHQQYAKENPGYVPSQENFLFVYPGLATPEYDLANMQPENEIVN